MISTWRVGSFLSGSRASSAASHVTAGRILSVPFSNNLSCLSRPVYEHSDKIDTRDLQVCSIANDSGWNSGCSSGRWAGWLSKPRRQVLWTNEAVTKALQKFQIRTFRVLILR